MVLSVNDSSWLGDCCCLSRRQTELVASLSCRSEANPQGQSSPHVVTVSVQTKSLQRLRFCVCVIEASGLGTILLRRKMISSSAPKEYDFLTRKVREKGKGRWAEILKEGRDIFNNRKSVGHSIPEAPDNHSVNVLINQRDTGPPERCSVSVFS